MAFETLGSNLLDLIKIYNYAGAPQPIVKMITKQVVVAIGFLHRNKVLLRTHLKVIHTDLKPENILLKKRLRFPPKSGTEADDDFDWDWIQAHNDLSEDSDWGCKLSDLGNACWTYKHFTKYIGLLIFSAMYKQGSTALQRSFSVNDTMRVLIFGP